jgi:hypothetical protein
MKLLSEFYYKTTFERRGVLSADLVIDLQKGHTGVREFYDKTGALIAVSVDDIFTLFKGFSCDLCSPAWRLGVWWIGTWTTRREALGAFLHDFSRSCLGNEHTLWKDINDTEELFWDALGTMKSKVQKVYHWVTSSKVGRLYHRMTFKGPEIRVILISDLPEALQSPS